MKKLRFIGIDYWSRPVYKDESGRIWKNVNLDYGKPAFYSATNNSFDGEPDTSINDEFEIVKQEDSEC